MNEEKSTALEIFGGRAVTPRQVEAIEALVSGTVPPHAVSKRSGRAGKTFSYVKHTYGNQLIRDAFGMLWSYEVLSTDVYDDASASARVCLTLYVPQEDGSYLEIRTTAVGAHEDTTGKMCKAFMAASAASRGLCKTLFRRFGLGSEFYTGEAQMSAQESWTALWRFAQRKDPGVEQDAVVAALKQAGITRENLVDRFEEAYAIVNQVVSTQLEEMPGDMGEEKPGPPSPVTKEAEGPGPDPLVEMAKEELGAEPVSASTPRQKVNFVELYAYAEREFGFNSSETKAVLLDKFGREWWFADKKLIVAALKEAKNA